MYFEDRRDAGRKLAAVLADLPGLHESVVLALPRGGVPVAFEVATAYRLPLDIFLVRKLGVPGQQELAMGAIASNGAIVFNSSIIDALRISQETIASVIAREKLEMERQEHAYRGVCGPLPFEGRSVILVDDGLATGASMRAAARAVQGRASHITIAVPVASDDTCRSLAGEADRIVCAKAAGNLGAVGAYYHNFQPTSDEEVRIFLAHARRQLRNQEPLGTAQT